MNTASNRAAGLATGETCKLDAMAVLAVQREAVVRRGQRALLTALLSLGTATADEVRDAVDLPDGIDPVCLGAVPLALVRAGIIRRAGFTPTCRPMAHARPLTVWTLADQAAAERWLLAHPELPDPDDEGEGACQGCPAGFLFPIHANEPGATAATAAPGMET